MSTNTQIWQHRTAGEQYVVAVEDDGTVSAAEGPLARTYVEQLTDGMDNGEDCWIPDDAEAAAGLAADINTKTDDYRIVWPYISG